MRKPGVLRPGVVLSPSGNNCIRSDSTLEVFSGVRHKSLFPVLFLSFRLHFKGLNRECLAVAPKAASNSRWIDPVDGLGALPGVPPRPTSSHPVLIIVHTYDNARFLVPQSQDNVTLLPTTTDMSAESHRKLEAAGRDASVHSGSFGDLYIHTSFEGDSMAIHGVARTNLRDHNHTNTKDTARDA